MSLNCLAHRSGIVTLFCLVGSILPGCDAAAESRPAGGDAKPAATTDAKAAAAPAVVEPVAAKPAPAEPLKVAMKSTAPMTSASVDPLDWPMWRGPEQNGISCETGLIDKWDPSGENVVWSNPDLGTRSTPIVMRGKLYSLARSDPGTKREGERVVCADAATGKVLWENKFNVFLSDVPDTRVAWSAVVGDPTTGRVYAMGVCGYLQCLDGDTGKTIWNRSLNEEFGLLSTYGGRTNVPILHEDLVIISAVIIGWGDMAKPMHRFLAFNKSTGEVAWINGTRPLPDDTTYSTPIIAALNGQKAMIFGSGDGAMWAFQPRTGVPIWQYKFSTRGLNVPPLVDNGKIYMGQSEENREGDTMGAVAAVDGTVTTGAKSPLGGKDITETGELWREKAVMVGRSGMILVDGRLYSVDDSGNLYIQDAATGAQIGKRQKLLGTIMRASLLYADGKIYAVTTSAWHVLKPTEKGVKFIQKLRLPEGEEIHGSPIASHGKIYLASTEKMYCLGLPDAKVAATERPVQPQEAPIGSDTKPAHVQVLPVEALIHPGEKIEYQVRLYNDRGQLLGDADGTKDVQFSIEGAGQIDSHGVLTTDKDAGHSAVIVTAKVGDIAGTARVRVEPPLPWKFDFEDGQVPITWIGARYRHQIREVDGNKVMVKITTIPKGTRSQSLMGPVDLHDYTIQADVRGSIKNNKMPDMAVIAQRYTLDLMGAKQQLQVRSWTAQLEARFAKNEPVAWKPDVWYTIKLRAATDGPKAVLKGKAWERGQPEPEQWTLEAVDDFGNLVGSPGLFGNANDAEIFIDNILVTPN